MKRTSSEDLKYLILSLIIIILCNIGHYSHFQHRELNYILGRLPSVRKRIARTELGFTYGICYEVYSPSIMCYLVSHGSV